MEQPPFLIYFAEKIGKPLSAFTKDDWKDAALTASCFLEDLLPHSKKPGRPRKSKNALAAPKSSEKPRGRPRQNIGALPIDYISELVDELRRPEVRARWPDAPHDRKEIIRRLTIKLAGNAAYAGSVARREREFRRKRK